MVFLRWSASISHVSRYLKKPFPFGYFPNFEQIMPETKLRRRLIGAAIACLIAVWGCLTILYSQAIGNPDFVVLIILGFLATIIIAVGLIINYRLPKKQYKPFMESVVFTILSFTLVGIILSFPRAEISSNLEQRTLDQNADGLDPNTVELIKQEHQKAVNEILERTKADDAWFKNKFILVGGLFAAFLAYTSTFIATIAKDDDFAQKLTSHIGKVFTTSLPISVLGLACVVSLAIDLHLRNNAMVTHQLGLWIQTYVEHTLNKDPAIYIGWETFLRTEYPEKEGMHRDVLFSIINGAHFYFTSLYLYVLYIACVFFYFSSPETCVERNPFRVSLLIFSLVHVTLAIVAGGGNSFPGNINVKLALWPKQLFPGNYAGLMPFALSILVTYLTFTHMYTLYKICQGRRIK